MPEHAVGSGGTSPPREIELKLHFQPPDLPRLRNHPLLAFAAGARGRLLHNRYFDTPQFDLRQRKAALRLRRAGSRYWQTLKLAAVDGALAQRDEWELPLAAAQLDLAAFSDPAAQALLDGEVGKNLVAVFDCEFRRLAKRVRYAGAEMEVALDSGRIVAGASTLTISELELEWRSGPTEALFLFARRLQRDFWLLPETRSKAARGYAMLGMPTSKPAKARKTELSSAASAGEAVARIVDACLSQWRANEPGAATSEDIEYVHQMRVALRRLRAALSLAERLPGLPASRALRGRLRWLAQQLGELRDRDVLAEDTLATLPLSSGLDLQGLLDALHGQRRRLRHGLHRLLLSRRYASLVLAASHWCWKALALGEISADETRQFARRVLNQRHRQFWRLARQLPTLDLAARHEMRIVGKKLRYGGEFFAELFPGDSSTTYLAALGGLQDVLGSLNDAALGSTLLNAVGELPAPARAAQAYALGYLSAQAANWEAPIAQALQTFGECKRFWRKG